jgi:hypothetical protein
MARLNRSLSSFMCRRSDPRGGSRCIACLAPDPLGDQGPTLPSLPRVSACRRRYGLGMVLSDQVQVAGGSVALYLLYGLAAGDHAADGRVLQTPGERPRRHGHGVGDPDVPDLLHQLQLVLDLRRIMSRAPVVAGGDGGCPVGTYR